MSKEQKILGIDPGTIVTGYGVVAVEERGESAVDFGCIRPPARKPLSDRYWIIFEGLVALIQKFKPAAVVVETQFVQKNIQSAIKLGMARGVVIVAAKHERLPIFEYSPTQAKLAVTGSGRASKQQVQGMVKHLLGLKALPEPEDAADALSLAICHSHVLKWDKKIGKEL